jgi:hypothetical protein
MERKFEEIKQEILRRAHEANACKEQYGRAYKAEDMAGLCRVIKDNWNWCCIWNVVTPDLLEKYREEFAGQLIYMNVDTDKGFLFASGNATVRAWGNATVRAWDNATVRAWGNATVEASGNATVRAWDNATVRASGNATVRASGNATVRAWGNATVRAWDNATVEASGNAYCTSYWIIECKLSEKALYRVRSTNTVYFASDDLEFVKQDPTQQES